MQSAPAPALYRPGGDVGAFVSTWIKIWAGLLAVVIIFLVAITATLRSINGNLAVAQNAVVDVGGETKTLPRQVDNVNVSLKDIDDDVKPIHAGTQRIRASLQSIQGKLTNVDRSLASTSGTLTGVQGGAGDIRSTLVAAQVAGSQGTNRIWRQVGGSPGSEPNSANEILRIGGPVEGGAETAIDHLQATNVFLARICRTVATLSVLGGPGCQS